MDDRRIKIVRNPSKVTPDDFERARKHVKGYEESGGEEE